jgi:hypothetical protein
MRFGRNQSAQNAHAAITDREDIDPAGHWAAGRPETPRQGGGVGPQVLGPVLLEREVRRGVIQKLLSPVAQRLSADRADHDEFARFPASSTVLCPLKCIAAA